MGLWILTRRKAVADSAPSRSPHATHDLTCSCSVGCIGSCKCLNWAQTTLVLDSRDNVCCVNFNGKCRRELRKSRDLVFLRYVHSGDSATCSKLVSTVI